MIGLLGFLFLPLIFRWLARLAAWTIAIITAIMAAPVTTVTLTGLAIAWSRGWPPARLRQAAAWSLPMTGAWLTVTAITTRSLHAVITAPFTGWIQSWRADASPGRPGLQGRTRRKVQSRPHLDAAPRRRGRGREGVAGRRVGVTVDAAAQGARGHAVPASGHRRYRPGRVLRRRHPGCHRPGITAPPGPPAGSAEFLDRLDSTWLERAYAADWARLGAVRAAAKHLPDIALRYRTLLDRLGPGFDGTATLADTDAWYFILEGTREQSVAQAQALAITELLAHAATDMGAEPRAVLLACDDYSAVSGKVPLWQLYERGRSLGIGVQVSAQSWQGLGNTDDERYRIAATADGGIWLMRTPYPEPIAQLAGTRRVIETAAKIVARNRGDEGTSRIQHAFTADPGIARRLAVGQAGYIHRGGCTWIHITRPQPSSLPVPPSRMSVPLPGWRLPAGPRHDPQGSRMMNPRTAVPALIRSARLVPARLRHGRPWRLAARTSGALILAEIAFHSGAGPAAITGTLAGIITWLAFAARADVAPPPGR